MQKEENQMDKLVSKIIITGQIKAMTGLHIGGSSASIEIGGIDNNIIKTTKGVPYIPGSSLKGKLRNMLAKAFGSPDIASDLEGETRIGKIFGVGASDVKEGERTEALLRVRDAYLDENTITEDMQEHMDLQFSEVKYENSINRITGKANPRPLERVPAGALFDFEMIYDAYENETTDKDLERIAFAMELLEMDYLGGSGSRGSGKVSFQGIKIKEYEIDTNEFNITPTEKELETFSKLGKKADQVESIHTELAESN